MLSVPLAVFLWLLCSQVEQIACQVNVALGKNATQISTSHYDPPIGDAVASRAVDGNTSSRLSQGSVALTVYGKHPWWEVDLDENYYVSRVVVYNRQDPCCGSYLREFVVLLKNSTGFQLSSTERTSFQNENQAVRVFDWWPPQSDVRYVRISSTANINMGIAEVQVYSAFINNIAFNKPVTLSSVPNGQSTISVGALAVDNRTDTAARTAGGEMSPWVEVHLRGTFYISRVRVKLDTGTVRHVTTVSITLYCNSTLNVTILPVQDLDNWVVEPELSDCSAVRITALAYNGTFAVSEVNVFPGARYTVPENETERSVVSSAGPGISAITTSHPAPSQALSLISRPFARTTAATHLPASQSAKSLLRSSTTHPLPTVASSARSRVTVLSTASSLSTKISGSVILPIATSTILSATTQAATTTTTAVLATASSTTLSATTQIATIQSRTMAAAGTRSTTVAHSSTEALSTVRASVPAAAETSNDDSLFAKAMGGVVGAIIATAVILVFCKEYRVRKKRRIILDTVTEGDLQDRYRTNIELTNPVFGKEVSESDDEDYQADMRPLPATPECDTVTYTKLSTVKQDDHKYAKASAVRASADPYASLSKDTRGEKHTYSTLQTVGQSAVEGDRHDYELIDDYRPTGGEFGKEESSSYLRLNEGDESESENTGSPTRKGTVYEPMDDDDSPARPRKDTDYVIPSIDYEPHGTTERRTSPSPVRSDIGDVSIATCSEN